MVPYFECHNQLRYARYYDKEGNTGQSVNGCQSHYSHPIVEWKENSIWNDTLHYRSFNRPSSRFNFYSEYHDDLVTLVGDSFLHILNGYIGSHKYVLEEGFAFKILGEFTFKQYMFDTDFYIVLHNNRS